MFRGNLPALRRGACIALLIAGSTACLAQGNQAQKSNPTPKPPPALTSNYVKTGLYFISGGGGNTVMRLSASGIILVDGNLSENFDELLHRIKKIVDQPIRVVINTSHYREHTSTNAQFLAEKINVIAQENVKGNLTAYNAAGHTIALPSVTYDREQALHFGPVEVRMLHFGNAHTSGDTVVYFADLRAVALGDLYSANPEPDLKAGGSLAGWSSFLGEVLKLDFDVAIPGNGPSVTRADVEACKARIDSLLAHKSMQLQPEKSSTQLAQAK